MQNINRDVEIKNKLIVTRGEVVRDNGGKRRVIKEHVQRTHEQNQRWVRVEGGRSGRVGWEDAVGGGITTTLLEQQYNKKEKIKGSFIMCFKYILFIVFSSDLA